MGIFVVFPLAASSALLFGRRGSAASGAMRRCVRADGDAVRRRCRCSSPPISRRCRRTARTRRCCSASCCWSTPGCWRSRSRAGRTSLHALAAAGHARRLGGLAGDARTTPATRPWRSRSCAAFVALYLAGAGARARGSARPLPGGRGEPVYAAPLLLFVFPVLAASSRRSRGRWRCSATLLALLVLCRLARDRDRARRPLSSWRRSSRLRRRRCGRRRT